MTLDRTFTRGLFKSGGPLKRLLRVGAVASARDCRITTVLGSQSRSLLRFSVVAKGGGSF